MRKIIYTILFLFITINTFGQAKNDKIKALKISFFTKELNLTENEAEKFWPVYNAYYAKTSKIKRQDIRNIRKEIKENKETLSNEKATDLLNKLTSAISELHNEESKLITKLKNVLSPKKIILLKMAEDDFKRKILEQYRKKHSGGNNK